MISSGMSMPATLLSHVFRHAGGLEGRDAAENEDLFVEPPVPHLRHEFLEPREVVDALRLDELGPGPLPSSRASRPDMTAGRQKGSPPRR